MASRLIIFDPQSLVKLMTHYSEGDVPMDVEVTSVGFSQFLPRWIGMDTQSREWEERPDDENQMYHFRYEGKKTLSWGGGQEQLEWKKSVDAPKQTY
jgi:hypothetical protein